MRPKNLVVRAGAHAAEQLRTEGFRSELFDTLVGASGGPKWLVLRPLDDVLIDRMIRGRSRPIATLGSSIGSFRHACFAQAEPHAALSRFAEGYVEQAYDGGRPSMEEVSRESDRILGHFLGDLGSAEIVDNKLVQSHVIASRLRNDRGHDRGLPFQLQLGAAASLNLLSRRLLQRSFARVLFHTESPSIEFSDFDTQTTKLSSTNLQHALLASGSIPMVMAGVRSVCEIPGTLFDGGIIDYHFDFTFRRKRSRANVPTPSPHGEEDSLVLFPHFFDRITPGWFDKPLSWRRPTAKALSNVVMIAPSEEFVKGLPGGRVPDRSDFLEMKTEERIRRWRRVMDESRALADDLNDLFDGKNLEESIVSFPS